MTRSSLHRRPFRTLASLLIATALLLTACSSGSEIAEQAQPVPEPDPTTEPTTPPAPTSTPPPAPTAAPEPTATPEPTVTPVPTPEPTATTVPPTPEPAEEPADDDTQANDADPDADPDAETVGVTDGDDTGGAETTEDAGTVISAGEGAAIFAGNCAGCHGAGGEGSDRGPSILGVGQFFPDDVSPITNLVTNGGTRMPEFGSKLTTDQIDVVVQWVVDTFQ